MPLAAELPSFIVPALDQRCSSLVGGSTDSTGRVWGTGACRLRSCQKSRTTWTPPTSTSTPRTPKDPRQVHNFYSSSHTLSPRPRPHPCNDATNWIISSRRWHGSNPTTPGSQRHEVVLCHSKASYSVAAFGPGANLSIFCHLSVNLLNCSPIKWLWLDKSQS